MAYAELPEKYYLAWGEVPTWDAKQMHAFADATRMARRMTAWTRYPSLKYINIRVDIRGGGFILTDYDGNEASDKIMGMLKIPVINN